jgi:hypothetical protein
VSSLQLQPDRTWAIRLLRQVKEQAHKFVPQDVSNVLVALARLQQRCPGLLAWEAGPAAPAAAGGGEQARGAPQRASSGYLQVAQKPHAAEALQRLLASALKSLPLFKPQELANCLWALASLGQAPEARWMQACLCEARSRLGQFKARELANVLWSLARLRWAARWVGAGRALLPPRRNHILAQPSLPPGASLHHHHTAPPPPPPLCAGTTLASDSWAR